jgi:hypothetical protein
MKKAHTLIAALCLLLAAVTASAQTLRFKAEVPFPFVVGNQTLPAGTYQFQRLLGPPSAGDQVGMVSVRSADGKFYRVVVTSLVERRRDQPASPQIVFTQSEGNYYLAQVWGNGDRLGQQLRGAQQEAVAMENAPSNVAVSIQLDRRIALQQER